MLLQQAVHVLDLLARTHGDTLLPGTVDRLGKAPLAGRTNIVITRDPSYAREGVKVAADLDAALAIAQAQCALDGRDEIIVAGGAEIYALALPVATRLYVTTVDIEVDGDTHFPPLDLSDWQQVGAETHPEDDANSHAFTIAVYQRAGAA